MHVTLSLKSYFDVSNHMKYPFFFLDCDNKRHIPLFFQSLIWLRMCAYVCFRVAFSRSLSDPYHTTCPYTLRTWVGREGRGGLLYHANSGSSRSRSRLSVRRMRWKRSSFESPLHTDTHAPRLPVVKLRRRKKERKGTTIMNRRGGMRGDRTLCN